MKTRTNARSTLGYYSRELRRRLQHYVVKRREGFRNRGSLERAARAILAERATDGFRSGGHFRGIWPRDLCFGSRGFVAAGYQEPLRETAGWLVEQLADVFYTDFHDRYHAATPAEGVDTFPALVLLLAECDGLAFHADEISRFASIYCESFFDDERNVVTGAGSSWWDSARSPREAYNTAMLLAAVDRLETNGIETVFTDRYSDIRSGWLSTFWTGSHFAEHRESTMLACDANVVPLYLELLDNERARRLVRTLCELETERGLRMRSRPFARSEVHPFFLFHRDYHYHIWPWNSLMYANGLRQYGFEDRARDETKRIERLLRPYGNFLEVLTLAGDPYVKHGYASAEDFTVAAALWTEYETETHSGSGHVADDV